MREKRPTDPLGRDTNGLRGRHVVVLNWKDSGHPETGGAEVYCHEVAKRFVQMGSVVTLLTARAEGQAKKDTKGGVEIHRMGGKFSVYPLVLLQLLKWRIVAPRRLDLILDCQNGIPFFAPLVVGRRTAVVMLIFHVHQDQFRLYMSPVAAFVGRWLESAASRLVYRRRTVVVVSASTRQRVRSRLKLAGAIFVVPCGSESVELRPGPRTTFPSIVCVGRVVPHKRVDLLINALPEIIRDVPNVHVDVIGEGPSRPDLESLARAIGVDTHITFHGYVSSAQRDELSSRGWLAVNPSVGEGWGLSVIEANAAGRPAVCLDVDGLRDAVRDGVTGWVAATQEDFARTIIKALAILSDVSEAAVWSSRAQAWAKSFSWDDTASKLSNVMLAESDRLARARGARGANDLSLRVSFADGAIEDIKGGRRTDIWRQESRGVTGLLYGLDERDLGVLVERLNLGNPSDVRVARTEDLLLASQPIMPATTVPAAANPSSLEPPESAQ